jgi:predicted MFS family arabinose efflux permease
MTPASDESSALAVGSFRLYFVARSVSMLGTALSLVALPVLAFQLTGSPALTALLTAVEAIPYLVLGLPAGALVDRLDRKKVMVVSSVVSGASLLSIALMSLVQAVQFTHLLVAAIIVSTSFVFSDAAGFGLLPALVGRTRVASATSVLVTTSTLVGLIGPALAGVLIATIGTALVVGIDGATYLAAACLTAFVRVNDPLPSPTRQFSLHADIIEGLRYIWRRPEIRALTFMGTGVSVAGGAITGIIIVIGVQQLGYRTDDARLGLLYAATAIGTLAASLLLKGIHQRLGVGVVVLVGVSIAGVSAVMLAMSNTTPMVVLFLAMFSGGSSLAIINGIIVRQVITPSRLQSRVNTTARLIAWGGAPLGATIGGVAAQIGGTSLSSFVAAAALGGSLAAGLAFRVRQFPRLAQLGVPEE